MPFGSASQDEREELGTSGPRGRPFQSPNRALAMACLPRPSAARTRPATGGKEASEMLLVHPAPPAVDLLLMLAVAPRHPPRCGESDSENQCHPRVRDRLLEPRLLVMRDELRKDEQEGDAQHRVDPADKVR